MARNNKLSEEFGFKSSRMASSKKKSKCGNNKKKKSYNEAIDHQAIRHQKINFKKYLEDVDTEYYNDDDELYDED